MSSDKQGGRASGLVFSPWNLVLLVPFIVLLTPLYNRESPELFGMPFFYWFQFAMIMLGVLATITVYRMTRKARPGPAPSGTAPTWTSWTRGVPGNAVDRADHLRPAVRRRHGAWASSRRGGGPRSRSTTSTSGASAAASSGRGSRGSWSAATSTRRTRSSRCPRCCSARARPASSPCRTRSSPTRWCSCRCCACGRCPAPRGYVTPADFVRGRYGSSLLALLVAITGIVATMPYIALQLVGLEAVLRSMGFNASGFLGHLPLVIAFVILALYTYQSGSARARADRVRQGHPDLHRDPGRGDLPADQARRLGRDLRRRGGEAVGARTRRRASRSVTPC